VIGNRLVTGTINPEATLVATKNIWAEWLASTKAALSFTVSAGGATGSFAASALQWMEITGGDRNGVEIDEVAFQLNDDDLSLTLAAATTTAAPTTSG